MCAVAAAAGDGEMVRLGRWCAQRSAAAVAGDAGLWVDSSLASTDRSAYRVHLTGKHAAAVSMGWQHHCISLDITLRRYRQIDSIQ